MLVLFSVELARTYQHRLVLWIVIVLITLMMAADVTWIASQWLQLASLRHTDIDTESYRVASGFTLMIACVCFSLSHWMFSFKYWSCA